MRVVTGLEQSVSTTGGTVLTIGNFDGVHRGHARLVATANTLAQESGSFATVLTFEPHPSTVVAPDRVPPRLTTLDQKLRLLEAAGADTVVIAKSEPALLGLEAEEFIHNVIKPRFAPLHIVEGPSFGFGKGRRGNVALLRKEAAALGCAVHEVEPVTVTCRQGESILVSSSRVRDLLSKGDVERAGHCLGRSYELVGTVAKGAGRGRTIGFPTANLSQCAQLVPGEGVYSGTAMVDNRSYAVAISIGHSPTFGARQLLVEAHVLDFESDLYDRTIAVRFERRLRDQRSFDSPAALIEQIKKDVADVRAATMP